MFEFQILKPFSGELEHGVVPDAFSMDDAVMANQVHGDEILEICERPSELPQCDAFITKRKNLPIMVKVADCQGVLIYDPKTHTAAVVHSGWRGSACNILGKTIDSLSKNHGSSADDLLVAISPSLGPCCAEFSDPKNELPDFCQPFVDNTNHVDFWGLSAKQCMDAGVPENQIELAGRCTKCQPGYPSHRKGDSGRMGVFAKLI